MGKNKQNARYRDLQEEDEGHGEVAALSRAEGTGQAAGEHVGIEPPRTREEVRRRAREIQSRLLEERRKEQISEAEAAEASV